MSSHQITNKDHTTVNVTPKIEDEGELAPDGSELPYDSTQKSIKASSAKRKLSIFDPKHSKKKKKKDESFTSVPLTPTGTSPRPSSNPPAGHRPVTSCTHCRQHKIKCNASERFPSACSRCERMDLKCEIDPQFRPKKGSQIQSLRNDVDELRSKIEFLTRNESLIAQVMQTSNPSLLQRHQEKLQLDNSPISASQNGTLLVAKTHLQKDPTLLSAEARSNSTPLLNDSTTSKDSLPPVLENAVRTAADSPHNFTHSPRPDSATETFASSTTILKFASNKPVSLPNTSITEFNLGDVKISLVKATELHQRFTTNYLPYLPIMGSNDCVQLYQQSQLLFWTVMLTACLSDPEPTLYMSLASLIKQLAIETCWIRTPRSTHIVQALLILGTWPLPNQKVLDDCSYRFVGLAKNLSLQLGLHRGKFISEFSRTQVALPDAEKWRTRTWLAVFFGEQFWSSNLGLPPSLQTDFLLESARVDESLPKHFRCLLSLAIFQAKLVSVMGLSVTSPDGLMEPKNRAGALSILERELERLAFKLQIDDIVVEIYYLYVQLMVCCFAFLPETPSEDQTKYVTQAYISATRIVTIMSKLTENRQLTEYPIYIRHSVTVAAFVLFRLHLTPYLLPKYIDSARQSILTVHRLFRNMLAAWKDVENDISRTATVLEKLNFVIITNAELFTESEGIIVRMRSHLTGSLFYDLVWCIHEARRRLQVEAQNKKNGKPSPIDKPKANKRALPLPFYNQITKDNFTAITTTTPSGTTVTTLVPTDQAILNAKASATAAGLSNPTEINGIPLAMLEATGSLSKQFSTSATQPMKSKQKGGVLPNKAQEASSTTAEQQNPQQHQQYQPVQAKPKKQVKPRQKKKDASAASEQHPPAYGGNPIMRTPSTTSIAAGANGMVPPPLFPSTAARPNNTIEPAIQPKPMQPVPIQSNPPHTQLQQMSVNPAQPQQHSQVSSASQLHQLQQQMSSSYSPLTINTGNSNSSPNSVNESPVNSDIVNNNFIDSIFQQQGGANWMENGDDFLGWLDINMAPEF